ncbi:MAG: 3-hydroxyacyl-ACP dehydratase FabZ [Armatimonadetes bacterium]|nr:3-hydroxyacyl-ACP dehydratase FabZ [Armatimonadota bacterium]
MEMDIKGILSTLPHRYPFLMIDRIVELVPGVRAVGIKNVTANEPQFTGHWPENPVMPGVLMLEAMAQVGGVFLLSEVDSKGKTAYFAGMDGIRFRRTVIPGDQLRITAELVRRKGGMGKVAIVAKVGEEVAVEGEFMFALVGPDDQS